MNFEGRLRKEEWEVRPVEMDVARRMIEDLHYARGASNTAIYIHGLFPAGAVFAQQCVGVAWWLAPIQTSALKTFPANWRGVLSLSRLAIGEAPKNAATFLLAASRKLIEASRWPCLVTYADTWRGHTGAIYRADNWKYVGLTAPERVYTIDGRMVARKAGPKCRTHAEMLALGAEYLGKFPKHKYVRMPA